MATGQQQVAGRLALVVLLLTLLTLGAYVALIVAQGGAPVAWFTGGLLLAALLAGQAWRTTRRRTAALVVTGVLLCVLGVLALATIGLPLLAAGVIAFLAAARTRATTSTD
ncbi:hypothetical protein CS0771_29360 [Catellatospora sp. IY07-71]|uniref:hypothetical protein n=1 Tax=Catellatospora sp. IY07-71 TaxID=2728827 RepID=UPI001BB30951|nr:hypothetical protein [Catellatospora sp. IY07-71]BCJ73392.1 hypothetical protein CS0771_29360 [Catellatospora sp. IY07-71]